MPLGIEAFARAVTKRARRGLYAGKMVRAGNNISEDGGNKTRRIWKPNAQNKRLYSEILGRMVPLRVTAAALRNIDKAGGLDAYILGTPDHKLDSDVGSRLKLEMLQELTAIAHQQQQSPLSFAAQGVATSEAAVGSAAAAEEQQQQQQPGAS